MRSFKYWSGAILKLVFFFKLLATKKRIILIEKLHIAQHRYLLRVVAVDVPKIEVKRIKKEYQNIEYLSKMEYYDMIVSHL